MTGQNSSKQAYPIVVIGASAGGLDALQRFLAMLPQDRDVILKDLKKNSGSSVSREVSVKDRVFSETVQLLPQFKAARIYAYDITERQRAEVVQGRLSAIGASAKRAALRGAKESKLTIFTIRKRRRSCRKSVQWCSRNARPASRALTR